MALLPASVVDKLLMNHHRSIAALCWAFCGITSACSLYVDDERVQCKTDADCSERGPAFAGSTCRASLCQPVVDETWTCLDRPLAEENATATVHVNLNMVDLLSQKPISGLDLTLCSKLDANCAYPISRSQSNEAGQIDVAMPVGFDGYLQAEGAGIYPTLIFPPRTSKQRAPSTLPIVPFSFIGTMFRGLGIVTMGDDRSAVLTTALDCLGRPAPGMLLTGQPFDDQSVSYVLEGGLPSQSAQATDATGSGGFVNIKAGSAVITSTLASNNRLAGTVAVQTRPGYLTMVLVTPNGG